MACQPTTFTFKQLSIWKGLCWNREVEQSLCLLQWITLHHLPTNNCNHGNMLGEYIMAGHLTGPKHKISSLICLPKVMWLHHTQSFSFRAWVMSATYSTFTGEEGYLFFTFRVAATYIYVFPTNTGISPAWQIPVFKKFGWHWHQKQWWRVGVCINLCFKGNMLDFLGGGNAATLL